MNVTLEIDSKIGTTRISNNYPYKQQFFWRSTVAYTGGGLYI